MDRGSGKARTVKACDRCRIKKVKCDGSFPCTRCSKDNSFCQFGSRGKGKDHSVSSSHVEQLEAQRVILVQALKAIWRKYAHPDQLDITPDPSVHEIVSQVLDLNNFKLVASSDDLNFLETISGYQGFDSSPDRDPLSAVTDDTEELDGDADADGEADWDHFEGIESQQLSARESPNPFPITSMSHSGQQSSYRHFDNLPPRLGCAVTDPGQHPSYRHFNNLPPRLDCAVTDPGPHQNPQRPYADSPLLAEQQHQQNQQHQQQHQQQWQQQWQQQIQQHQQRYLPLQHPHPYSHIARDASVADALLFSPDLHDLKVRCLNHYDAGVSGHRWSMQQ